MNTENFDKQAKAHLAFYHSFMGGTKIVVALVIVTLVAMAVTLLYQKPKKFERLHHLAGADFNTVRIQKKAGDPRLFACNNTTAKSEIIR
ncbi:MAG: hypothetical protein VW736_07710 [Alphaproteobacteria bacterium]